MDTLSELLLEQAYEDLEFKQYPNRDLEIFNFKGLKCKPRGSELPPEHFDDWLHQRGAYTTPDYGAAHPLLGGIRLIVQQWDESSRIWGQNVMPFEESMFQKMIQTLGLPADYPMLFCHGRYTTPRFEKLRDGTRATFVYQSPNFERSFMTLVLAYNPSTSVTSGFLGYIDSPSTKTLINSLIKTSDQAIHPLLLPTLCLNNWISILRKETYEQDNRLGEVKRLTGLMNDKTNADSNTSQDILLGDDFRDAHAILVVMHNGLANSLVSFIQESSRDLKLALEDFMSVVSLEKKTNLENINVEFEGCIKQMDMIANGLIHMRERLLNRMDMQLRVLYNLMQQRDSRISQDIAELSTKIAVASKRDSSAMKAIAVLTMLFLPGTAVASIFSMSSFFSVTDNARVAVSPEFWLYWAIVLPLTGVVLTIWLSWLRLDKIRARREEDKEVEGRVSRGSYHL